MEIQKAKKIAELIKLIEDVETDINSNDNMIRMYKENISNYINKNEKNNKILLKFKIQLADIEG
jgi:hypothetical protein